MVSNIESESVFSLLFPTGKHCSLANYNYPSR